MSDDELPVSGQHALGQLDDRQRLGGADVVDLAPEAAVLEQIDERAGRVVDVAEAARLVAVAVHLERLVRQRGAHEAGDDHPVLAALPRADGVEQARDDDPELALLVQRQGEELVERLRVGVRPALRRRRPVDAARVLARAAAARPGGRRRPRSST